MRTCFEGKTLFLKSAIIGVLFSLLVSACQGNGPTQSPTEPLATIPLSTAVAATVQAEVATLIAPTATQEAPLLLTPSVLPTATQPAAQTLNAATTISGIQTSKPGTPEYIRLIVGAGAAWTHFTALEWDRIEPERTNPPTFFWDEANEEGMLIAAESGLTIIANVSYTPAWAQKIPGYACGPIAQESFQRFGIFLQEAVLRYSKPPYNIKYWELGNEPDVLPQQVEPRSGFGCWGDSNDPYYGGGYYAEMLRVVYPYIKAADPEAQVLIGGLLFGCNPDIPYVRNDGSLVDCSASRFFEGILANGGGSYFDGVSFHAYDYYYQKFGMYGHLGWHSDYTDIGPVVNQKTMFIRQLLEEYGYNPKDLYATEIALLCGSTGKETQCLTDDFQNTKAYYVVYAMITAQALDIKSFIWYELRGWRASELVQNNLNPLPAYDSFQFVSNQLSKSTFSRNLELTGMQGFEFIKTGTNQRLWVLWTLGAQDMPLLLPQMPEGIYNVWGETQTTVDALMLSPAPVFVLWPPGAIVDPVVLP
jgi:hypothetical protein